MFMMFLDTFEFMNKKFFRIYLWFNSVSSWNVARKIVAVTGWIEVIFPPRARRSLLFSHRTRTHMCINVLHANLSDTDTHKFDSRSNSEASSVGLGQNLCGTFVGDFSSSTSVTMITLTYLDSRSKFSFTFLPIARRWTQQRYTDKRRKTINKN